MLKMFGVVVAIGIGVLVVWLLVDLAWYLWGGLGVLIFGFLLVFFLATSQTVGRSRNTRT